MFLSVIIPTRNRAKYLAGALASITGQTYPQELFEVIVVDNGSTDNTKEVCQSFNDRIKNLRYFYEPTPGLHVGRHLGMREAKSEILVYADDDIEAFPTWLEAIAESFQNPEVVLVGGKNLPKWEAEPPDWILKMWEKDKNGNRILGYLSILDLGDEKKFISPFHVFGCNFSIRKNILLEAGGFHPDAMPKELIIYRGDGETHVSEYIHKKKYKVFYHPDASVHHLIPGERLTFYYYCQRAYYQAISDAFREIRLYGPWRFDRLFMALFRQCRFSCKKLSAIKLMGLYSYIRGYMTYHLCIAANKSLLNWVQKSNYWK
ncbi:MAG: glycosyltransferase family 2 protein [Candidatus Parvarchaeota archaeon]|nr:glycosyltransferase family 2 protein [Candidatus Jingweiarchaeum tengchongense]